MRKLLNRLTECVSSEKDIVKELKRMADHLMTVDRQQDQELLQDDVNLIFGNAIFFLRMSESITCLAMVLFFCYLIKVLYGD